MKALFLGLACAVFCGQTAQAGFFDELFGQERSPQVEPDWPPENAFQPRKPRRAHQSHETHHSNVRVIAQQVPSVFPAAPAWEVFLDDPTLRNGDAVMTPDGLRIFTGSENWDHNPADFAKLTDITGLSQPERTKLASVEKQGPETSWQSISHLQLQTGRSVAAATDQVLVKGPNGRKIRYVGP